MVVQRKRGTYADIEQLPEHLTGELIGGELFVSPRPALAHAQAASELQTDLGSSFGRGRGGPGGWRIIVEPELHLRENVLVPDVAGWRRERFTPRIGQTHTSVSPDWIAEVLSPSTMQLDRGYKMKAYARAGVPWLWLLDPLARTLEVYQAAPEERWMLLATHVGDAKVAVPPFDAVTLDLAPWWLPDEE